MRRGAVHHATVNPFEGLDREWKAMAGGPSARRAMRAWAAQVPEFAGFDTPAELVAQIGRMGNPDRSCLLLAHLLVLAGENPLAARAVLQAVIPGLRRAAGRRWRMASNEGPWFSYGEIATDTVSAGWEAIRSRAGERHEHPARIIVRFVEGRLRRIHHTWRDTHRDVAILSDESAATQSAVDAACDTERQALSLITDAVHNGALKASETSILIATAVQGHTVAEVERVLGWAPKSGYRVLHRARQAIREWTAEATTTPTPAADCHHAPPPRSRTRECSEPARGALSTPSSQRGDASFRLTVELPSHPMTLLASPELGALLAKLIRRRADLTRPGAAA